MVFAFFACDLCLFALIFYSVRDGHSILPAFFWTAESYLRVAQRKTIPYINRNFLELLNNTLAFKDITSYYQNRHIVLVNGSYGWTWNPVMCWPWMSFIMKAECNSTHFKFIALFSEFRVLKDECSQRATAGLFMSTALVRMTHGFYEIVTNFPDVLGNERKACGWIGWKAALDQKSVCSS